MIKRPVIYNEWDSNIEDADGNYICGIDNVEGWDDAEAKSVGNEIAAALNDDGWKLRCEELEVVAAALYLGHDDAKEQFSIYREVYLADQGNVWKPTEEEPFPY